MITIFGLTESSPFEQRCYPLDILEVFGVGDAMPVLVEFEFHRQEGCCYYTRPKPAKGTFSIEAGSIRGDAENDPNP
ncbi:MAG: hypothetical protein ABSB42_00750 [Tepidisphaeraceae bacterium]